MLSEILASDPAIEVVGTAPDPLLAREKSKRLPPGGKHLRVIRDAAR